LKLFQFKAPGARRTGPFVAPRNDANDSLISKKVHLEISSFSFERTEPIVR